MRDSNLSGCRATRRACTERTWPAPIGVCLSMLFCVLWMGAAGAQTRVAQEFECFTEPYDQVDVAASDVGVLRQVTVVEGDVVEAGQVLATLNDAVLEKSLQVARAAKDASGALRVAMAELQNAEESLAAFRTLRRKDHASERELQRALTTVAIADAKVQIVRDELSVRRAEYERTLTQLENRRVIAPLSGVVTEVYKAAGEFVSPADPVIAKVVDLKRLKAIFSLPREFAGGMHSGQIVSLVVGENLACSGLIEFVSPTADPQSGTVRIKIRIENPEGRLPSGVLCRWDVVTVPRSQNLSQSDNRLE